MEEVFGWMYFGIKVGQTIALGRIVHKLKEEVLMKNADKRQSRHLLAEKLDGNVPGRMLAHGAAYVHGNMIVSVEPSDIQEPRQVAGADDGVRLTGSLPAGPGDSPVR